MARHDDAFVGQLDRIGRVGELLLGSIDHDDILRGVAQGLCEFGEMDRCLVVEVHRGEAMLRGRAGVGLDVPQLRSVQFDREASPLVQQALHDPRPIVLDQPSAQPDAALRAMASVGMDGSLGVIGFHPPSQGPIAVGFVDRYGGPIARDEPAMRTLSTFTYLAALALQNAELVETSRRLTAVLERSRVAAEVHDGVSQALFVTRMKLQEAYSTPGLPDAARHALRGALRESQAAGEGLHEALYALDTDEPDAEVSTGEVVTHRSLAHELLDAVSGFARRTGIAGDLNMYGSGPEPVEACRELVLRATRECLTNVEKYARASEVAVDVRCGGSWWMVEIADDAVGDPLVLQRHLTRSPESFGLSSLASEARRLGGRLWIRTSTRLSGIGVILAIPTSEQL